MIGRDELTKKAALIAGTTQELLFLTEPYYDAAIIGLTDTAPVRVIYNADAIIRTLVSSGDFEDEEEAYDYYGFNIEGAYMGEHTPVFVSVMHSWTDD